jgi:ribosomal protein uS17
LSLTSNFKRDYWKITLTFCADKKCPFTGGVSIRGRILTGRVVSTKMHRTIIIRREYLHFIPKYSRYEKRHKNLAAHVSPAFRVEEGDVVTVGQCRPLSKTVGLSIFISHWFEKYGGFQVYRSVGMWMENGLIK